MCIGLDRALLGCQSWHLRVAFSCQGVACITYPKKIFDTSLCESVMHGNYLYNSFSLIGHILKETEPLTESVCTPAMSVSCRCVLVKATNKVRLPRGCQSPSDLPRILPWMYTVCSLVPRLTPANKKKKNKQGESLEYLITYYDLCMCGFCVVLIMKLLPMHARSPYSALTRPLLQF